MRWIKEKLVRGGVGRIFIRMLLELAEVVLLLMVVLVGVHVDLLRRWSEVRGSERVRGRGETGVCGV